MKTALESPIIVYGRDIRNRVVFQPMEGCDGTPDGAVGELTRRRYIRFANAAPGIIWFEATAVTPEGRANPRQLFMNPLTMESFRSLVSGVRRTAAQAYGFEPLMILQLTHSGRFSKPHGVPEPIVAYRNSLWERGKENQPYVVASDEYLAGIPGKYADAAGLAAEAGFDGVDVKCCHGYLLNELLSARERGGIYGGELENRMRLYLECVDAVKSAVGGEAFVTTRLNACDCFPYPFGFGVDERGEIDLGETKIIIKALRDRGIELINITLGNPYLIPHFNRPCLNAPEDGRVSLERIRRVTSELSVAFPEVKLVMSGLSFEGTDAVESAADIVGGGVAEFAGFGRMTLAYPEFFRDYLADGKLDGGKVCLKCGKCTELMRSGTVSGCPVRDSETYMPFYKKYVLNK